MVDVLSAEQRRLNMSHIRGRDTKPEMLIRRGLHARGLRYRLHVRTLPGRPDLVFPKYHTVAFVHGCFWHAHGCALSKLPAIRQDFWKKKFEGNSARDRKAIESLHADGWRVLVVWECALRGPRRMLVEDLLDFIVCFVTSGEPRYFELAGLPKGCR
ncbi:very short patch repair endonuclease [Burkholderia vietnamiensis]|uniref:very short patch repair endonuclease n=1 Tax=Burkholderia vietnamiensis TaxID=60552 RepID=UPI001CF54B39|nr:very short patch repair endonuclease [Burkholderia vietnamiensis]MCA8394133.1 very short patch repair endonuclease [Burkholderia vietnamiensis]HDR8959867.1 DNA mismatch endonuclease Vsr [Burkholderia vietnamiensis]HDR9244196.1 DNA mismatch endonuclease Vsr [Burkholderia vietnamiensis]